MYRITVLPGDGIGPEVIDEALKVLNVISNKYNVKFDTKKYLFGGIAIDKYNTPYPKETEEACLNSDAVLLGAVGGPKWDMLDGDKRPEAGLLALRKSLGVYANLRPATLFSPLRGSSPLKDELLKDGLDVLVVRELTGGIYFGPRGTEKTEYGYKAYDTEVYDTKEIERIAYIAFEIAKKRKKKVTSVDKANILDSSRLWRKVVNNVSQKYPDIELNHLYIDNCSMQLIKDPSQFDVILTSNMFGDILSDEASQLTGSIGMLPSASLRGDKVGLYEPVHGSAPDIAGTKKANPLATILSLAMMLEYSFDMVDAAKDIRQAVNNILEDGYRTADLGKGKILNTQEMGDIVVKYLKE
ncbi:3-isopropylmalate dehydrogenase [Thermoanaerobacterium sp. RBIITD]|uniref:3-isopropylmalate dehydrogenase n=1 Tax=Thermoanaerobacterium sp. RBIITD TaxID=1550240 RepID=UPI000BB805A6|nr:3-isopropylmalate dehydrogenase [Thermoanaerobacterium sp. RBIITD]SNX53798.1 3-isopropylmalate dehydrogenase [Thermoanaerobacterium sp. RBIITD]